MARAKRTDRAEARRAYRAYLQAQQEAGTPVDEEPAQDEPVAGRWRFPGAPKATSVDDALPPSARKPVTPAPVGRMSMMQAAKAAYRTPHYRDDIRNIGVLFRTPTLWVVLAVCLASGAYVMLRLNSADDLKNDFVLSLILQFVLSGYPMLPPMLAGFLAPRSSWLAGGIASIMAILVFCAVLVVKVTQIEGAGSNVPQEIASNIPLAVFQALPFGVGMAAAAAWYKRFLPLTSPPRPDKPRSGKRPAPQRRRPATRG